MNDLTLRNARIIYKNFSGKSSSYNPDGRKNFSVVIEDENLAQNLLDDGWNVKPLKKREETDPQIYQLPVAVVYGSYPPTIRMISKNIGEILDENTVRRIDYADIVKCDMIIHPRTYEVRGSVGVKAYLKSMNVYINTDELEEDFNRITGRGFDDTEVDPF